MGTRKDQHKVGTPKKPRGQQTGFAGNPDQNREEVEKTPALRGGTGVELPVLLQHQPAEGVQPQHAWNGMLRSARRAAR